MSERNNQPLPHKRASRFGPKVRSKNAKATMLRLWEFIGRQRRGLILVFLLVAAGSILTLIGPLLIGKAVDTMIGGRGEVDFPQLINIVLVLSLVYALIAVLGWIQVYVMAAVAQETVGDLRKDLFTKIQTLPLNFFDRQTTGDIMSRLSNDVETVNNTLSQSITHFFASLITVTGAVFMMFYLNPYLALVSFTVVPLGIFITTKIASVTRNIFLAQQKTLGEINGFIEETISGQKEVKAFGREGISLEIFDGINNRLKKTGIQAQIYSGLIPPIMNLINNLSFALVALAGGWLAVNEMITIGMIASFLNYSRQFARPLNEIANQYNMLQSALAGSERVFEIMDEQPEPQDPADAFLLEQPSGEVSFQNVTFGYLPNMPILKNISIHARPGETVALVGPTGAGKTTVVNLLNRFYEINEGSISVDGRDIRTIKKDSLRGSLGIVLQDSYLFSDTVRENIRYGRLNATDQEVEEAARLANAETFILRLPEQFDTILTEEGGNLSQGERQLLTIARAILANPSILILDEATSSVDTRTEMHLQKGIRSIMKGRTGFVIAHRLSTIRRADQILVINQGEIIEQGNHEELLAKKGLYYDLYHSQFKMTTRTVQYI